VHGHFESCIDAVLICPAAGLFLIGTELTAIIFIAEKHEHVLVLLSIAVTVNIHSRITLITINHYFFLLQVINFSLIVYLSHQSTGDD
jgi:hypothetical protein